MLEEMSVLRSRWTSDAATVSTEVVSNSASVRQHLDVLVLSSVAVLSLGSRGSTSQVTDGSISAMRTALMTGEEGGEGECDSCLASHGTCHSGHRTNRRSIVQTS